jgi:polyhydroxybutyrate depolymerase
MARKKTKTPERTGGVRFVGRWTPRIAVVLVLVLGVAGCATSRKGEEPHPGVSLDRKMDLRAGGFRRSYRVHVPTRYTPDRAWPLVVVIHGAFSTAREIEKHSRFSELADREGFIALYPNGMGLFGLLQHWNAGHCCGKAARDHVDDVAFVTAAVEDVRNDLHVDPGRIYAVGFSNGGMLVHRLAAEHPELWAAVAPMAGSVGGRPDPEHPEWHVPDPAVPVSVLLVHGRKDEQVPYRGGPVDGKPGAREYLSAEESARFWARSNGCENSPDTREELQGTVTVYTWKNCRNRTEVQLYALKEWGHVWPGPLFTARALEPGNPFLDFDAAETAWEFFRKHAR